MASEPTNFVTAETTGDGTWKPVPLGPEYPNYSQKFDDDTPLE
jgi:hypothetical protein